MSYLILAPIVAKVAKMSLRLNVRTEIVRHTNVCLTACGSHGNVRMKAKNENTLRHNELLGPFGLRNPASFFISTCDSRGCNSHGWAIPFGASPLSDVRARIKERVNAAINGFHFVTRLSVQAVNNRPATCRPNSVSEHLTLDSLWKP